jgi:serine/threonine-protein kinase
MKDPLEGTPYRGTGHILGRGASGIVIEAEHRVLGKPVVAKILRRECADDRGMVERLRIEAQALARLSHSNLVAVSDLGKTAEGRAYLIMERLLGRTLKEEVAERGPLPIGEALELARQLLLGLSAAHEAGLVHRDIKPENLFVCEANGGRPRTLKILDFGIAKVLRNVVSPLAVPTAEGFALGSPRYLAPEQALGAATVDARADIYGAAAVLYVMLTGRDPFAHHSGIENLIRAHAYELVRNPSEHAPVPAMLDRIVLKGLAKKPADRYPTALAFLTALAAVKADIPPPPPSGSRRVSPRKLRKSRSATRRSFLGNRRALMAEPPVLVTASQF